MAESWYYSYFFICLFSVMLSGKLEFLCTLSYGFTSAGDMLMVLGKFLRNDGDIGTFFFCTSFHSSCLALEEPASVFLVDLLVLACIRIEVFCCCKF